MEPWLLIVFAALAASMIASVAGTGGGVILLPALVYVFGVREAVPMYALILFAGNLSRVGFNYRLIDLRVVRWFLLGALPCAALGAWLFTRMPDGGLLRLLGAFLVISVAWRYLRVKSGRNMSAAWFAPIGAAFSVVSGVVGSAGPFLAPFYLSYGLVKGAFIGTEALGTAAVHMVKLTSYQALDAMTAEMWIKGLALGPVMILGSYLGKRLLDRMPPRAFVLLVDAVILGSGIWFLAK
jgi:uncharacterized protein